MSSLIPTRTLVARDEVERGLKLLAGSLDLNEALAELGLLPDKDSEFELFSLNYFLI